jgi:16S rRNA (cytosine1402-N4)-methyltransferase
MPLFHIPVMQKEVVQCLLCHPGGIYVDGTIGGGGHAYEILENSAPDGLLIGIDIDDDALHESERRLKIFKDRSILVKGNFAEIDNILKNLNIHKVDGILLDLGMSSHQIETAERGFSFTLDAPLDMRMDRSSGLSAYDLVNTFTEKELENIIKNYGEEIMARRIARAISARRKISPVRTTVELADIITRALPPQFKRRRIHPATKTFQAIRIYINKELLSLYRSINCGIDMLNASGRFLIISFHSLEDRIVKNNFRSWEKGCICPPDFPRCSCHRKPKLKILTKKPLTPGAEEIATNPRARSARLRIAEKV